VSVRPHGDPADGLIDSPKDGPADGPPGLALAALEGYLRQTLPGLLHGQLSAQLLAGGRSNLTYLLTDGRDRWVLRRPPLGHVLETAHDMRREHRLLAALSPTDVPVPAPVLLAGPEVIGAPFYLMEFADGQVLRERSQLEQLAATAATALADELVDVLLRLHRLDPEQVGLADGVDFSAHIGTPIYAASNGTVLAAGPASGSRFGTPATSSRSTVTSGAGRSPSARPSGPAN